MSLLQAANNATYAALDADVRDKTRAHYAAKAAADAALGANFGSTYYYVACAGHSVVATRPAERRWQLVQILELP